jgi:outer membrane immunogenic protein
MRNLKFVFSAAIFASATIGVSLASAADLSPRLYTKAAPVDPGYNWTGFYFGGNVGYHFGDQDVDLTGASGTTLSFAVPNVPHSISTSRNGVIGGGQIGYNYQLNPGNSWVVGIEADFQAAETRGRTTLDIAAPGGGFFPSRTQVQQNLDDLGTVRGRLGYAFGRLLVFGTGGLAYGQVTDGHTISFYPSGVVGVGTPNVLGFSSRSTEVGYTVGGGGEYAIPASFLGSSAITIKAEYLYYNLGTRTLPTVGISGGIAPGDVLTYRFKNDGQIARLGFNFKY